MEYDRTVSNCSEELASLIPWLVMTCHNRDAESLRRLQLYSWLQLSMLLYRLHVDQSADSEETVCPTTRHT